MNRATILGNAGKNADLKYTKNGMAVCNFSVATSYKLKNGEKTTTWHTVVAWGPVAEYCAKNVTKGSRVFIDGSLATRKWTDKAGLERYVTEINAQSVLVQSSAQANVETPDIPMTNDSTMSEEDIPF